MLCWQDVDWATRVDMPPGGQVGVQGQWGRGFLGWAHVNGELDNGDGMRPRRSSEGMQMADVFGHRKTTLWEAWRTE